MNKTNKTNKNTKLSKGLKNLLTVRELKTWLDGYCSAHGDDWSPSPEQWNIIKNKIFSLNESNEKDDAKDDVKYAIPMPANNSSPTIFPQFPIRRSEENSSLPEGRIGLSEVPPMVVGQGGALKTPDKGVAGGPSDFA